MKRILLIGGTGFVGRHLKDVFDQKDEILATGSNVNVKDRRLLSNLIKKFNPDQVVYLASITTLGESFANPETTIDITLLGLLRTLEILTEVGFRGRLLNISSSEVYGDISKVTLPISENTPTLPRSPYAVAKRASEILCDQWSQSINFEILSARPFNHIGPGQSDRFAISNFAKQIVLIKNRSIPPKIFVGNIDATRDFTDVRDVVRAYKNLLNGDIKSNVYNICSGSEYSIRFLIDKMCEIMDIELDIVIDSEKIRAGEQERIFGDPTQINSDFGWKASIPIEKTLEDILLFWSSKVAV